MLFLYIPLSLAFVSLVVITVIVWRKMPYLRKLTPEAHQMGDTILHDYAPELVDRVQSIPWRHFVRNILVEFEKILRRGRLLMSSLDRVSDKIIRGVRRVHVETGRQQEEILAERRKEEDRREELRKGETGRRKIDPDEIDIDDPDQLRQEEQRLIVAIAQNPKNVAYYSRLAQVYMRLENYADAVEALAAAVQLAPDETLRKRLDHARVRKAKAEKEAAAAVAAGQ